VITGKAPFTVAGAQSTGKFAGATGAGKVTLVVSGNLLKLGNGKYNESQNPHLSPLFRLCLMPDTGLRDGRAVMATSAGPPGGGHELTTTMPPPWPPAKLRPGQGWYWLAVAVLLAGVAWAALASVVLIGRVDAFPRVPDPGQGVISLTHSGGYLIYYEGPGASAGNVPAAGLDVTPVSGSGAVQSIRSYSGSLTYQFGSREGSAVASLQIARPGRFLVRATSSAAPPGSHLAIGSNIAGGIAVIVFPALVLVLAAIVCAIVVAVTRHNRAKRARLSPLLA
jgi:hypothetical protein